MSAIFLGRSFRSTERAHPCFVTDKRKRSGTWKDWGLIGGNIAVIITFLRSYEFPVHRITYFKLDHFLLQYWHSWRTAGWIRLNYLTHRCISFKKCIWKKPVWSTQSHVAFFQCRVQVTSAVPFVPSRDILVTWLAEYFARTWFGILWWEQRFAHHYFRPRMCKLALSRQAFLAIIGTWSFDTQWL